MGTTTRNLFRLAEARGTERGEDDPYGNPEATWRHILDPNLFRLRSFLKRAPPGWRASGLAGATPPAEELVGAGFHDHLRELLRRSEVIDVKDARQVEAYRHLTGEITAGVLDRIDPAAVAEVVGRDPQSEHLVTPVTGEQLRRLGGAARQIHLASGAVRAIRYLGLIPQQGGGNPSGATPGHPALRPAFLRAAEVLERTGELLPNLPLARPHLLHPADDLPPEIIAAFTRRAVEVGKFTGAAAEGVAARLAAGGEHPHITLAADRLLRDPERFLSDIHGYGWLIEFATHIWLRGGLTASLRTALERLRAAARGRPRWSELTALNRSLDRLVADGG